MARESEDDLGDVELTTAPSTGKLKGGPKKGADVKLTPMKKIGMPKGGADKSGGKSGGAFKVDKPGKISAKIGHTSVRVPSTKKAETKFSLPKSGSSKMKRRA